MPTFYARSTTIRLSTADHALTTTAKPVGHSSKEAADHLQNIIAEFANGAEGGGMSETSIDDKESGSHIRFLGKRKDMPFFMIRAGKDSLSSNNPTGKREAPAVPPPEASVRRRRSLMVTRSVSGSTPLTNTIEVAEVAPEDEMNLAAHSNPGLETDNVVDDQTRDEYASRSSGFRDRRLETLEVVTQDTSRNDDGPHPLSDKPLNVTDLVNQHAPKPRSLCLTVSLSKSSFITPLHSPAGRPTTLDVKIDVYFNGTLCASNYIPERFKKCGKDSIELRQRFTGHRIAHSLERPWIIAPPEHRIDGAWKNPTPSDKVNVDRTQRWNTIAQVLRDEAEKIGRDKHGGLSMLGEYLEGLSQLEMPAELRGIQKNGEPKFGLIDVVLTAGKGLKDPAEAGNLSRPTSMRVIDFKSPMKESVVKLQEVPKVQKPIPTVKSKPKTFADAHIIAQGLTFHAPRTASRTTASNSQMTMDAPKINNRLLSSTSSNASTADITCPKGTMEPSAGQNDVFRTPDTPSAAPSAMRRRQSRALAQSDNLSSTRTSNYVAQQSMGSIRSRPRFPQRPIAKDRVNEVLSPNPLLSQPGLGNRDAGLVPSTAEPRAERSRRSTSSTIPPHNLEPPPKQFSSPGRHILSNSAKTRLRSEAGSFAKASDASLSKPQSTPQSVPQKRHRGPVSSPHEQPKAKRSRMNYHVVVDDKMTLAEEMASIEASSKEEMEANNLGDRRQSFPILTRQQLAREKSTTPTPAHQQSGSRQSDDTGNISVQGTPCPASKPAQGKVTRMSGGNKPTTSKPVIQERQSKVLILSLGQQVLEGGETRSPILHSDPPTPAAKTPVQSTTRAFTLNREVVTPAKPVNPSFRPSPSPPATRDPTLSTPMPNHPPQAMQSIKFGSLATPKSSSKPPQPNSSASATSVRSRRRRRDSTEIPTWPTPALSEDCVISFAPDSVRQVRLERPGWFRENSVLMGVRFVIG